MARLFEDAWQTKGTTFVREYDSILQKSSVRTSPHKSEYYLEDSLGEYKSLLDPSISLRKVIGSSYNIDDAYGVSSGVYATIREDYFYKNDKSYNNDIGVFFLDIETSVGTCSTGFPEPSDALEPIVLIQFWSTKENKGYVIGREEWVYRKDYSYDFDLEYIQCDSEVELLNKYLEIFKRLDPYIITAWNSDGFDFPYIYNRFKRLGIDVNKLSNYGKVNMKTKKMDNGQIQNDFNSIGHWYVDAITIYKKFVSVFEPVPSMSLDFVGQKETGISKVDHDNYIKFDDFRIGKYKILGNETDEQKNKLIHKCAVALEDTSIDDAKRSKYKKYIKEKSHSEFIHYGVQDFVILKGIFDSRNLIGIVMKMSDMMACRVQDSTGTLKYWSSCIAATSLKDGLIVPPKKDNGEPNIIGGYVAQPAVGKHKWILSADINSMYPLLGIVSLNLSPETWVPKERIPKEVQDLLDNYYYDQDERRVLDLPQSVKDETSELMRKYNLVLGLSGSVYTREKEGFLPTLVKKVYADRKVAKGIMFGHEQEKIKHNKGSEGYKKEEALENLLFTEQLTLKLAINALYGALSMKYFSLFNEDIASTITMSGRVFIIMMSEYITEDLEKMMPGCNPAIYNDTDSFYFSIEPFINKYCSDKSLEDKIEWADRFYEKIVDKSVQRCIRDFSDFTNAYNPSVIGAEREVVADAGIFTAKKKYTIRVRDNEGVRYDLDKPKIKVTGLEVKTSGIAPFTKKYLTEAIPVMLDKDEEDVKLWFRDVKTKYTSTHILETAKTIGVSKIADPKWGKVIDGRKSSPPFGSKTVIATNDYITRNNLQEEFQLIDPGTKVKVLYLLKPNPFNNAEAFAFNEGKFAERFDKFIDRDTNFEKFFISPLQNVTDALGFDVTQNTEALDEW